MSDNRKYYYLKLKESYFDDDAIVLLESMQDGMLYSNILLKLYLKSLKYGGTLQLDENLSLIHIYQRTRRTAASTAAQTQLWNISSPKSWRCATGKICIRLTFCMAARTE